jgi:hypothetical protein
MSQPFPTKNPGRKFLQFGGTMKFLLFALTPFLFACSLVANDTASFKDLATKYGTPNDVSCAALVSDLFEKKTAILNEQADGAIANAYKMVLLHRASDVAKDKVTQNCGQLATELVVVTAEVVNKVRP